MVVYLLCWTRAAEIHFQSSDKPELLGVGEQEMICRIKEALLDKSVVGRVSPAPLGTPASHNRLLLAAKAQQERGFLPVLENTGGNDSSLDSSSWACAR